MTLTLLARRTAASILGAGGVLLGLAAPAVADTVPGCTTADIAAVESQVAAAVAGYFFTHPEVNEMFTSLQGLSNSEARSRAEAYLDANPQTQAEIDAVRSPVQDLRNRCNIPVDKLIRGVLHD